MSTTARGWMAFTEKEWSDQLVGTAGNPGLARTLGWDGYHTLRSKGSASGYPDWTLWRDRVIFLELKTETGKVSPAQAEKIRGLLAARAEVWVVRPRHLDDIARVLQARSGGFLRSYAPSLFAELDTTIGEDLGEPLPRRWHDPPIESVLAS